MAVHCYEAVHRSGFLRPGTKNHSYRSPGLNVPSEQFEMCHQMSLSFSQTIATGRCATILHAVKTATATCGTTTQANGYTSVWKWTLTSLRDNHSDTKYIRNNKAEEDAFD